MYRFSSDWDLSHLVGCEVVEVSHVQFNLLFRFEPQNAINICGHWRVVDESGSLIDEGDFEEQKESYRTHHLLGKKVKCCRVLDPTTLSVEFEDGWALQIIDDSDQYECCHISPNIYV